VHALLNQNRASVSFFGSFRYISSSTSCISSSRSRTAGDGLRCESLPPSLLPRPHLHVGSGQTARCAAEIRSSPRHRCAATARCWLRPPATSSPPSPAPTSPPGAAPTQALPPRGRGPRWRALDQFNSIDAAGEGSGLKILATRKAYSGRSLRASKGTVRNARRWLTPRTCSWRRAWVTGSSLVVPERGRAHPWTAGARPAYGLRSGAVASRGSGR
jgi:hypothetical protein